MVEDFPLERCHSIILMCLDVLEKTLTPLNETTHKETVSQWGILFGEKETAITVMSKLVAMQKTVMELMQREQEQKAQLVQSSAPISDEDWELLALCVDRWRARKAAMTG